MVPKKPHLNNICCFSCFNRCLTTLKVPIKELKNRDPKKIYSRYFNNEIKNVAGLDLEIDEPYKPDLLIEFPNQPYSDKIVELLEKKFLKIKNG